MTNGNTYMMPFLTMQNILIYNKAYFRSCGLDSYCGEGTEIQNWTMDEWTEILDTLAVFRMRRIPAAFHPALKPCQSLNRFGGFQIKIPVGIKNFAAKCAAEHPDLQ